MMSHYRRRPKVLTSSPPLMASGSPVVRILPFDGVATRSGRVRESAANSLRQQSGVCGSSKMLLSRVLVMPG